MKTFIYYMRQACRFDGRVSRKEFFVFCFFNALAGILLFIPFFGLGVLEIIIDSPDPMPVFNGIELFLFIGFFMPLQIWLAIGFSSMVIKRLRDIGKSAAWYWITLLCAPFVLYYSTLINHNEWYLNYWLGLALVAWWMFWLCLPAKHKE